MHSYHAKIVIRKDLRKDGKGLIYLQAFINGTKCIEGLNIYVRPELFTSANQRVFVQPDLLMDKRQAKKEANDLNLECNKALAKANELFTRARLSDMVLTPKQFKEDFSNSALNFDFYKFWQEQSDKLKESRAAATIEVYEASLDKLKAFQPSVKFADLTVQFIDDFDKHLRKQGLSQNTVMKHHIRLKTFINLAIRYNIRIDNPYKHFRIRNIRSERVYLTMAEQITLIDKYKENSLLPHLNAILARFLFSCFTSLRWSDNRVITEDNIVGDSLVIARSRKTQNVLRIPLTAPGEWLLRDIIKKNIPALSLGRMNRELKTIAAACEMKKQLTTHVGRHTYATTYLKLGGKVEILQKILDHAKIETTMVYVHITEIDKAESGKMFNVFMRAA